MISPPFQGGVRGGLLILSPISQNIPNTLIFFSKKYHLIAIAKVVFYKKPNTAVPSVAFLKDGDQKRTVPCPCPFKLEKVTELLN